MLAFTGLTVSAGAAHADATSCVTDTTGTPTLTPINALGPGQSATSPNTISTYQGRVAKNPVTKLVMQTDGNLVLYLLTQTGGQGPAVWSSGTWGHPGAHAVSQSDGNFVVYDSSGQALWSSGTWGQSGTAGLLSTGGLRAGDPHNFKVWYSQGIEQQSQWCPTSTQLPGTEGTDLTFITPGCFLQSANAWLVLQSDGNLVIYRKRDNAQLWSSGTSGTYYPHLQLQADGNLVLAGPGGNPYWSAGTYYHAGDRAVFQSDGNFVVYDKNGTALWSTNTWLTANQ
ncbi:hypothetical protein [Kitasatospora acidiphila]|uniref:hypothetical protein n=1 Tax=Kitasatospora acidiphila TaxID=2567942 RepID=UPI0015F11AEF|nr:hypothetical protein [Kitasatospora acidiphila]